MMESPVICCTSHSTQRVTMFHSRTPRLNTTSPRSKILLSLMMFVKQTDYSVNVKAWKFNFIYLIAHVDISAQGLLCLMFRLT